MSTIEGYAICPHVYAVSVNNQVIEWHGYYIPINDVPHIIVGEFSEVMLRLESALDNAGIKYRKKSSSNGSIYYQLQAKEWVEVVRFSNHRNLRSHNILFDYYDRNILVMGLIRKLEATKSLCRSTSYFRRKVTYCTTVRKHWVYK